MKWAREVDPRAGAAIMFGVIDALDALAPAERGRVVDVAESWPRRKLRDTATALRHPPEAAPAPVPDVTAAPEAATRSAAQASLF